MTWADAVPNLLIGLREGLEAGLVVSILLAALRQVNSAAGTEEDRRISPAAIWLGVLGAIMLAASFAAVLTYSTNTLSSAAQEGVGGLLSVLAVCLVTGMVFWMRRTARTLSTQLRGDVARAVAIGAGALTLTAFLAVGREGLETTLFIWTAVKASGSTAAPLLGAAVGILVAVVLCWLLYERAIRIDLGKFFNRTAIALIVIAAGVLAYGLGDLQDAGWLPGAQWIAFDLTGHIDPNSWWVTIITGVTELAPKMTVLQVVLWLAYLVVVIPVFSRARHVPAATPASDADRTDAGRWERLAGQHTWTVAGGLVIAPALAAGCIIAILPTPAASASTAVSVTRSGCADEWTSGSDGTQTFEVDNKSGNAGEVNLENSAGGVVAEIETIGPGTTAPMSASLGQGTYTFVCRMSTGTTRGKPVRVSGNGHATTEAVKPVTLADLEGPNSLYQSYAAGELRTLATDTTSLHSALAAGNLPAAKRDWLSAQLDWERVGASYDSFGSEGLAVDGLPDGYPKGVTDPRFGGLHRIEYGLYHGQSARQLLPVATKLLQSVATVRAELRTGDEAGDPTNLPLRVHEVLEDALRDHLSGLDNQGSGMAYAETYADTQVTRAVLDEVTPLVSERAPQLVPTLTKQLHTLQTALLATRAKDDRWMPAGDVPTGTRQRVDAAIGALLTNLAIEPDLLEVPARH